MEAKLTLRTDFQKSLYGAGLVLASTFFFSLMGLGIRWARGTFRADSLVFYRSLVQTLCLLPWLKEYFAAERSPNFRRKFKIHFVRGVFGIASMLFLYIAYHHIPLAFASLLAMTSVFWASLLAWIFLGERCSLRQLGFALLTCLGLAISLVQSSREGWTYNTIGIVSALVCGIFMGLAFTMLKKLRQELPSREIVFFFGLSGLVLTLPYFSLHPELPVTEREFFLVLFVGGTGTIGQILLTQGFRDTTTMVASITCLFTPLLNLAVGFLFLGESPPLLFFLSIFFVLTGMVGLLASVKPVTSLNTPPV